MSSNANSGPRVLVVHDCLPHFDRSGADLRLMHVLNSLLQNQCQVTLVARYGGDSERYLPPLQALGITTYAHDAENLRYLGFDLPPKWDFAQVLQSGQFDVAILFLWFWGKISVPEQYLELIRKFSPHTFIVVLTDDRHGARERRMAQLTHSPADEERGNDYEQREMEVLQAADLVASISEDDRQGLLTLAPGLPIEVLPMVAEAASPGPGHGPRRDFLFLANFENEANREALEWLVREIWPALRRNLPDSHLTLAGSAIPRDLSSRPGVRAIGHVADLDACAARHRVFLSPIRFGTGIKTKNVMALSHGLPLITTTIGAEGLNLENGTHTLIAESAQEFAACAEQLYINPDLWNRLHEAGRHHVLCTLSAERLDRQVSLLLKHSAATAPGNASLHPFFACAIEKQFPTLLSHTPGHERPYIRMMKHAELAGEGLRRGDVSAALRHLRHTFALFPASWPRGTFFNDVFTKLALCYQALGDSRRDQRCQQEARACLQKEAIATAQRNPARTSPSQRISAVSGPGAAQSSAPGSTLALCMIARNAAKDLSACLASARKIVQEIVVADTGSTDETAAIASRFGANVVSIPWNQDFSAARNAALAQVKSDWVLVLDSDEELDPKADEVLSRLLRRAGISGFRVPLHHYVWDFNARGWDQRARPNDSTLARAKAYPAFIQQEIVRLFRRNQDIFFEGRVHEMVDRSILCGGGKIGDAGFCIHHFGHVAEQSALTEKNKLYRELGRLKVLDMPSDPHAYLELGLQEMDNFRNYEEAQQCFDRAAQLDPANAIAWLFGGMAALQRGQYSEALQRLAHVPKSGRCAALLAETQGEACFNLQRFEEAAAHYRRALQLSPNDAGLESKAGLCEIRVGRTDAGIRKLQRAVERFPSDPQLHDRLVAVWVSMGKLAEAAESAERRVEQAGSTPEAFLRAASIHAQRQDWRKASQFLERGVALFPESQKLKQALAELAPAAHGFEHRSPTMASANEASPCPAPTTTPPPESRFDGQSRTPNETNSSASA